MQPVVLPPVATHAHTEYEMCDPSTASFATWNTMSLQITISMNDESTIESVQPRDLVR